jgi:uncharacterized protein YdiU (UPF0061 family)
MEKIEGARLLLYNDAFARELRLKLPDDPEELAKAILDGFAFKVQKKGASEPPAKTLFATYYQDSLTKNPGDAIGDGRAAWFGEIGLEQTDGTVARVDIVGKGIGATPFAWLNHSRGTHRDGLMHVGEGIHDFITSEVAFKLGLETNRTLAVIEIPDLKMDERTGKLLKSVITIRIGPQFRIAHLRFFQDQPEKLRTVATYLIRRMLRLDEDAPVSSAEAMKYLEALADKMGEQSALYRLLGAVQRNPTSGNRTLVGGAIDTGTFRFLDANHPGYPVLAGRFKLSEQHGFFRDDLADVVKYLAPTGLLPRGPLDEELNKRFENAYRRTFADGIFQRLGLSPDEIARIPKARRQSIVSVFSALFDAKGAKWTFGGEKIGASAFDTRYVFSNFWNTFSEAGPNTWRKNLMRLFTEKQRSWIGISDVFAAIVAKRLISELGPVLRILNLKKPPHAWSEKAEALYGKRRFEPQLADAALEAPISRAVAEGEKGWVDLSRMAEESIDAQVDAGLLPARESAFGDRRVLERNRFDLLTKASFTHGTTLKKLRDCPFLLMN